MAKKEQEITIAGFKLPDEEVFVKFIKKAKGNVRDEKHIAFGGLLDGNGFTLPAKKLKNNNYANVLTDVEKDGLEELMGLKPNSLSIYRKDDNYWDKINIRLPKEGASFKLSDPDDYIKVRVLESYTNLIASSIADYNNKRKATYKFMIVRPEEESKIQSTSVDIKQEAYMAFGKIADSNELMEDLLSMYGIAPAKNSSKDFLKSEIGKRIEQNPKKFLVVIKDPDYKIKVLLKRAVSEKIIQMSGGLYRTTEGESIAFQNDKADFAGSIRFLKSGEGQDMRLYIESEIEKIKEGSK